jgi:hypothetical protein
MIRFRSRVERARRTCVGGLLTGVLRTGRTASIVRVETASTAGEGKAKEDSQEA